MLFQTILFYCCILTELLHLHISHSLLLILAGIPTYLLLNTTGLAPPARVDRVELLSTSGMTLKTIPIRYYPDRKPYSVLNVTEFIPPDEAFFLKVTGYDTKEYLFQRVSSVSYSNIVPGEARSGTALYPAVPGGC